MVTNKPNQLPAPIESQHMAAPRGEQNLGGDTMTSSAFVISGYDSSRNPLSCQRVLGPQEPLDQTEEHFAEWLLSARHGTRHTYLELFL